MFRRTSLSEVNKHLSILASLSMECASKPASLFRSRCYLTFGAKIWLRSQTFYLEAGSTFGMCFSLQEYQYWRKFFVFVLNEFTRCIFQIQRLLKPFYFAFWNHLLAQHTNPLSLFISYFFLLHFPASSFEKAFYQWLLLHWKCQS